MAGTGGARPGAGRKPGVPNRKSIERAEEAAIRVERARAQGKKLAVEILEEFMHLFAGMAAHHQPTPPGQMPRANGDPKEAKFDKYAKLAVETAAELAQFQSPRYAAIRLHTVPPPGSPGATPLGQPGDNAKVIDGAVTSINDPVALVRVYREVITRPQTKG